MVTFGRTGRSRARLGVVVAVLALVGGLWSSFWPAVAVDFAASPQRASVAGGGGQADRSSGNPAFSADGTIVAFLSNATNLVAGDTNGRADVFVRDLVGNQTTRVSVATGGAQGDGNSFQPSISGDGRMVAFASEATNLVAADTNGQADVFVHNRTSGATTRVSRGVGGVEADGPSFLPNISADAAKVAFDSLATNLVVADTNGSSDVFVRDLGTGLVVRASVDGGGAQGNANSAGAVLSANGFVVAFESAATNLVAGDGNGALDVFVRDLGSGSTERVSVSSGGGDAGGDSVGPSISGDGGSVAFASDASNVVAGDTNGATDVFVRTRASGSTQPVSMSAAGGLGNGASDSPDISNDGSTVAFASAATNLVAGDTNGVVDVFARVLATGPTMRTTGAVEATGASEDPDLAGPAGSRAVAFRSAASNLVAGDTNGAPDVFVVGAAEQSPTTTSTSTTTTIGPSPTTSTSTTIGPSPTTVAPTTTSTAPGGRVPTTPVPTTGGGVGGVGSGPDNSAGSGSAASGSAASVTTTTLRPGSTRTGVLSRTGAAPGLLVMVGVAVVAFGLLVVRLVPAGKNGPARNRRW